MSDEILQERRSLPVFEIAGRSYSYVWDNRALLRVPLLVVFAIQFLFAVTAPTVGPKPGTDQVSMITGLSIASIVCLMAFAVGVHRTVLLGEIRPGVALLRWDAHFRRYARTWLLVFLMTIGCVSAAIIIMTLAARTGSGKPMTTLAVILAGLAVPLVWLLPRMSLAFPAAAVGVTNPIAYSWRITRGSAMKLLAIFILATLPFLLLGLLLAVPTLFAAAMVKLVPSVAMALKSLTYVFVAVNAGLKALSTAILTVTLSLSYDALAERPASPE